jgi:hypothetical protein
MMRMRNVLTMIAVFVSAILNAREGHTRATIVMLATAMVAKERRSCDVGGGSVTKTTGKSARNALTAMCVMAVIERTLNSTYLVFLFSFKIEYNIYV